MTGEAPPVADRVSGDAGSEIREMFALAQQYEGDLARLEVGEPNFDTPEFVVDAAASAARDGATHYTPLAGIEELRVEIADKMARDNDVAVSPDDIVVTNGATEALSLALQSVVEPGDGVVVPTPAWPTYTIQIDAIGGDPVPVPLDPDAGFALDADRVVEAIDETTAAVLLCRPSNPTGRLYDPDAVREVVAAARENDAYVVADEVYERLVYEGSRRGIAAMTDAADHVVTINSFSKAYAMTGWRIGWLAANEAVSDGARNLHAGTTLCPSSVAQRAALAALRGPQERFAEMVDEYETRSRYVLDRLDSIPGVSSVRPEGTFYVFADLRDLGVDSVSASRTLLTEHGVATVPGRGFGESAEGFLRLSCAASEEELSRGLDGIESFADSRR